MRAAEDGGDATLTRGGFKVLASTKENEVSGPL